MFATAVRLLARTAAGGGGGKAGPVKVSNLGEQVQPAAESLFNILQAHGPLTAKGCWQHASQVLLLLLLVLVPCFSFFHSQSALLTTFIDCKERLLDLYSVVRLHLLSERWVLIIKLLGHFFFFFSS